MPVKKITKEMYECTCVRPECKYHTKPWTTDTIPVRCPGCKSRRWNRAARLVSGKIFLTFKGETLNISQWSKKLGLCKTTIPWRMKQGWPIEQVLSEEDWRVQEKP